MKKSRLEEGEKLGILKIETQKYQATQLTAEDEEGQLMVSTAKRSSLKAKNLCPRCHEKVNRQEMKSCQYCGGEMCSSCWDDYQKKSPRSLLKRDSSIRGK